jgi:hypothetical protein
MIRNLHGAAGGKNLRKRLKMLVFAGEVWYTLFCMNVLLFLRTAFPAR